MSLILASKSRARAEVLAGAGVAFDIREAGVDEDRLKASLLARGAGPREVAIALAAKKALNVSHREPGLVVGADQTLELDGQLYDKVASSAAARERLILLRGRRHQLHAAVAVAREGIVVWRDLVTTSLTMRDFSNAFLEDYLRREADTILSSVGCYRLESLGAQLFSDIQGDYFSILGLPLMGLLEFLRVQQEIVR